MNSKEAIEIIKEYKYKLEVSCSNQLDKDIEALDLAVKALEERPKGKWEYNRNGLIYCNRCGNYLKFMANYCPNCGSDNGGDV